VLREINFLLKIMSDVSACLSPLWILVT